MKKITLILALSLGLVLTGCSDEPYESVRHPEGEVTENIEDVNESPDQTSEAHDNETPGDDDMTEEVREEISDGLALKVEDTVNMRLAPSVNSAIVGEVGPDDELLNMGETEGWTRVTTNGKTGYIRSDLLIKE
ncbi:SH3 domain-containing protein [uncultured Anaerococcus sp.]|uniref:SH3 domain-containing protein n=1 Tax=uncultured Anaerococcus sp. TaxID=293428 RepID=UPI0025E12AA9|nr:SH3 domain-containing protein [uncultured Anaerococcus sp.]